MCSDPKLIIRYGDQVANIPKVATDDTTLTVNNADGGKTTFPVPSGTEIYLQVPGVHYNRMLSNFCIMGTRSDGLLQRGIGRSLTSLCQRGSLATGQGMPLFHSVKVISCPS